MGAAADVFIKLAFDFGAELKGATGLTTDLNRQAKELAKFTKEDLENQQVTEKTLKKQNSIFITIICIMILSRKSVQ